VCSVLSGYLVLRGALTLGGFQAFLLFGNMLISPVLTISAGINTLQQGIACAERIYEFLDEAEEENEDDKAHLDTGSLRGSVDFEHVRFSYEESHPLMRDVSFSVKPGMTVAIVGPTGAGKTTLINLLMRFYELQGGTIRLDGVDVRSLDRHSLREAAGIVLQDSWIFDGTIRENIGYGLKEATDGQIRQAARLAWCDPFIQRLADGYDTHVSDESAALSAGERQLLSIARTALADRRILVLDEATSQVDARTEYVITKAMERLMKGRTCFVIAHRLFTIRSADMILYMENGDVARIGTHEQLMEQGGKYAALYAAASDATGNQLPVASGCA
jgi:ATP-binding cassette subfamily B protein